MDNGIYDRQETLNLNIPYKVVICGCGGGYWDGVLLALAGVENFVLFDDDQIELSNLNRIPCSPDDIGQYKVDVLKDHIQYMRPNTTVLAFRERATKETLDSVAKNEFGVVVIDGTDDFEAQKEIKAWVDGRRRHIAVGYVRVGVNNNHFTVTDKLPGFDSGYEAPQQRCGVTIPSWISPVIIASALGVAKIIRYPKIDVSTDMEQIIRRQ